MGELFAVEIASMRDQMSTAEVRTWFAHGLMTASEVLEAAWRASHVRPDLRAQLARQFCASPDELIRWVGDSLHESTRKGLQ